MQTRFMPVLCEEALPWSLWMRFELEERDRLLAVLQFLRPITGRCPERAGYVRVIPTPAEDAGLQAFEQGSRGQDIARRPLLKQGKGDVRGLRTG